MGRPTVSIVYDGPAAPSSWTRRLESLLEFYFPPGFGAYARLDVTWNGKAGWLVRRALVSLGSQAVDRTPSLVACLRAEGLPVVGPGSSDPPPTTARLGR
jgi:hypothetical protein